MPLNEGELLHVREPPPPLSTIPCLIPQKEIQETMAVPHDHDDGFKRKIMLLSTVGGYTHAGTAAFPTQFSHIPRGDN